MKKELALHTQFNHLLQLDKIEPQHLQTLSPEKQREFRALLSNKLAAAKGEERDAFIEKISAIVEPDKIWEYNHARITEAIRCYVGKFSSMPGKTAIAEATGLSRKTIYKHLQHFAAEPDNQQKELYGIMKKEVLNKVLQRALEGDISAAKLYLQSMKEEATSITNDITINNQNNYLQINGTVLSKQIIEQLKPRQLQQIEEIIKKSQAIAKQ